ncbi:hypothetical protein [Agromyces larvae]|uniref:AAA+ ATPase domain-containing protein n=1 Tax=Agromyces larvae TaxID=2929802 RepID=A0ABY4C2J6_9MICO|nr:hypothetical protein [Agromyces larvae]UOE45588.1 hypothetical protein MTO99_07510 [Agromyces larvae]
MDDIGALLAAMPVLAVPWAKPARVAKEVLGQAQPKSLRAVQVNVARDPDSFHHGLAWAAMATFAGDVDFEANPNGPDTADAAGLLAEGVGAQLGEDLGPFVMNIVAESDLPLSDVVRERLDQLLAVVAQQPTGRDTPPDEADDGQEAALHGPIGDGLGSGTEVPSDEEADASSLASIEQLLDDGPHLAADLRILAESLEGGSVPPREHADILRRAEDWVANARTFAPDRASLRDSAAAIRTAMEERSEWRRVREEQAAKVHELQELLEEVEGLLARGRDRLAEKLLHAHDFNSVNDLRAAIADLESGSPETIGDTPTPAVQPLVIDEAPEEDTAAETPIRSIGDAAGTDTPPQPNVQSAEAEVESSRSAHAADKRAEGDASIPPSIVEENPEGVDGDTEATASSDHVDGEFSEASAEILDPQPTVATETDTVEPLPLSGPITAILDDTDRAEGDAAFLAPDDRNIEVEATVASLIADGREALAVVAARTLGTSEDRVRMLQLFAGAFGTRADAFIAHDSEVLLAEADGSAHNVDDNRLLFAAHARLALELGYAPVGSLDRFRQYAAFDNHPACELATEVGRLVARGFKRPLGTLELTALPDDWRRLADAADAKLAALQNISISYQRATRIVHYLARANQSVGGVLHNLSELATRHAEGGRTEDHEWANVRKLIATLSDEDHCERLLNETDKALSTSQQLRKPIIASARERLFSAMAEVAILLAEGLALRARAEGSGTADDPQGMANLVALAQRTAPLEVQRVGDSALTRLIAWLMADDLAVPPPASIAQLTDDELLPLFEIPRDASGAATRVVPTAAELQSLIEGRDPTAVFDGYIAVGNIQAAEMTVTRLGLGRSSAIEDKLAQAGQRLARASKERIAEVDRVLDRLRSLYDDDLVLQLSQELDALRDVRPGRYDLQLGPLADVRDRGEARLEEVRSGLRDRAQRLPIQTESERILSLLESHDEQLAFDYLNLAESGQALPVLQPPAGDDFGAFFPAVVRAAEAATLQRAMDNIGELRKHLGAASATPSDRMLSRGLKSWIDLVIARRADNLTEARLADVLRMLGLIPRDQNWRKELTRAKHAGYATYAVKANPIDRSYVPSLGTQAHGSYDVTIVWDAASPKRLLDYIEVNRRNEANIILYLQTMTVEQRLELRKLTSRQGFEFSPIVIDMPVIAWLSTREEPGWRITQRVTLPFTTLNPYTPFAGGEVPEEVFVGRESEQREIIDPTGSMFVYGGRQLGKSALLRRVERGIMQGHTGSAETFEHSQLAVYIDLKSEGIGESAAPSALWGALGPRLRKLGVLSHSGADWSADIILAGIESWLDADTSRRLILLLDEADNFLTVDAKDTGPSQIGGFPVLQRLKGLMERSGRRFKPVFAGLHQVQRFHGLPNTPVVHGGQDILIGPLKAVDARELVRDPLLALGYEFETPDTMWRLLRLTNYQASLIQIICEALVRHMRSSSLPSDGGRVIVTARDVDDVYAKRDVRDLIAQRFRWTINLDNRYKVIALVTARRSLESAPGERFPATELHDECAYFWDAGFSRNTLSGAEFFRYLDEMQGLGVLHRHGDEFGLRSPSILGLLGSKDTIEAELLEAHDQLEVDYQYNPTMNRRILTQDASGVETRSPLPDSELAALLDHSGGEAHVKVVAGSRALGIDRVSNALERAAAERPVRLVRVDEFSLLDQVGGSEDAHVLIDLSSVDDPARRNALAVLASSKDTYATVVLPVRDLPLDPDRFSWPVTTLHRWSLAGLQSWHESPFRRQDLRSATGGWPILVERAISLVMRGSSTEAALETIESELGDPRTARDFLTSASVPIDIARTLVDATVFDDSAGDIIVEPASLDYLSAVFEEYGIDAGRVVETLQRLDVIEEVPEGWLLDKVVALAVRSQGE